MSEIHNPDYLVQGTALELIRWITTNPKALELEFKHFTLFRMEIGVGGTIHECFHRGYLIDILRYLMDDRILFMNSKGYPLGIALL